MPPAGGIGAHARSWVPVVPTAMAKYIADMPQGLWRAAGETVGIR